MKAPWEAITDEIGQLDSRLKSRMVLLLGPLTERSLCHALREMPVQGDGDETVQALDLDGVVSFLGFPVIIDHRIGDRSFALVPAAVCADRDKLNTWLENSKGVMSLDDERWTRKIVRV